ncbi:helix-turn-helix domain-containing protein [Streptomyces typhae]|nr:helix-turn-helix domain-containing protein [Streptomyces typhae]
MLHTVFDGDSVPAADRFDAWREASAQALLPTLMDQVGCDGAHDEFRAGLRAAGLGPVQLADLTYGPLRARRTPRLIRASDPEHYLLSLIRDGSQGYAAVTGDATLHPGDLLLHDTTQPFTAHVPDAARYASTIIQIPRALVPLPADRVRDLVGIPVPGHDPLGALLRQFLIGLTTAHDLTPADSVRLGTVLLDLFTALVARLLDDTPAPAQATHREALLLRIRQYVEHHLEDQEMTPASVAAAHHISVRHLHSVFEGQTTGVAGTIRIRRLERCRRELADPALVEEEVRAIAARWGFARATDFSRAFRREYGMSPREFRKLCAGRRHPAP